MAKLISGALQGDADICMQLEPPTAGVHVGGGRHVTIPPDWLTRCLAGQQVDGCTAARVQPDGTLYVTDNILTQITIPAVIATLDVTKLAGLNTRLASAITVAAALQH